MLRGVDLRCLIDRAVVKPEDDVVVIVEAWRGDRYRLICVVGEDGQGAGGIESETFDGVGIYVMLIQNALNGVADTPPYVVCRLLLDDRSAKGGAEGSLEHIRSSLAQVARDRCSLRPCPQYRLWR